MTTGRNTGTVEPSTQGLSSADISTEEESRKADKKSKKFKKRSSKDHNTSHTSNPNKRPPSSLQKGSKADDKGKRCSSDKSSKKNKNKETHKKSNNTKNEKEASLDDNNMAIQMEFLPVAEAEPEIFRLESVTAYTRTVERITESDRIRPDDDDKISAKKRVRPGLLSVRIIKASVEDRLGISFRSAFGELVVSSIATISPFAGTPIQRGDRLISLDFHQNVSHWSAAQAASYLRSRSGLINFVLKTKNGDSNTSEACVYKANADMKIGVSVWNDHGRLRIRDVASTGLLGEMSALQSGDFVESINSVPVGEVDASVAIDIVRNACGLVILRVKKKESTEMTMKDVMLDYRLSSRRHSEPDMVAADELDILESGHLIREDTDALPRPGFISVTVYKPTIDASIGISFANPTGDELTIWNIKGGSILSKTPLAPGFLLHSINNIRCRQYSKNQAIHLVKSQHGKIHLVAQDIGGDPSHAVAMSFKPTPRAMLGLSLLRSTGGLLTMGNIRPDGLFADSVLNKDDEVIAINKISCAHLQPSDAVAITQKNPESVEILVRLYRANGVVLSHLSGIYSDHDDYINTVDVNASRATRNTNATDATRGQCFIFLVIAMVAFIVIIVSATRDECDPYYEYC